MDLRFRYRLNSAVLVVVASAAGAQVWAGPQHQGSGDLEKRESRIDKFEILATYTYAKALHDGVSDREAKERGIIAAVMGARSRGVGRRSRSQPGGSSALNSATSPRKKTLTAEAYDQEISGKLRPFYDSVFLPTMKKLVDAHLSYQQVKNVVEIPAAIGARITALEFSSRTSAYLKQRGGP
jgi:hypothetical protein